MDKVKNLFDRIEMRLDDIEEFVDQLEDEFDEAGEGESVEGIRNAIAKLWEEIHNIA